MSPRTLSGRERDEESIIKRAVARALALMPTGAGGAPSGPAGGVLGGTYPDPGFAVAMATDAEVATAISTHAGEADPHTGYQKESEKGAASGYASLDAGTLVPVAQLPTASTTAKGVAELATSAETTAGLVVQASDTRLSDARTPIAHAASHQNGGGDEVSVAGLSGLLADGQTPLAHATSHQNGGADELSVAGLSGLLGDAQTALAHTHNASDINAGTLPVARGGTNRSALGTGLQVLRTNAGATDTEWATPAGGGSTATTLAQGIVKVDHDSAGDPVALTSAGHGAAADPHTQYQKESEKAAASGYASLDGTTKVPIAQLPTGTTGTTVALGNAAAGLITTHSASADHDARYYTEDEVDTALDTRAPLVHAPQHQAGGSDAIKLDDLMPADDNTDLNASPANHGLMQKYPGGTSTFLRADGSFAAPPGGGSLVVGTATLAFGAAPGARDAFVDVTGLSGLSAASYIFAHAMNEASGSRGADDNRVDPPTLIAEYLTAASIRIYGSVPLGEIIGDVPVRWQTV